MTANGGPDLFVGFEPAYPQYVGLMVLIPRLSEARVMAGSKPSIYTDRSWGRGPGFYPA